MFTDPITLIHGDCFVEIKKFEDNVIDLTVTSPPYDNLREYNSYSWNFEGVAQQLYRVTKKGGILVWIVADQTHKGSETGTSFKQVLYFKDIGFNLHDTMIYAKKNPVPLNHNRYEQAFEYMFILSKGRPFTFNPLTEPCQLAGSEYQVKRNRIYDNHAMRFNRDKQMTISNAKIKQNIWHYAVGRKTDGQGHPAPFPEELAHDHILSWSNLGNIVFDPFMGSGTTGKMAVLNGRHFVGIELDKTYFNIANKRIKKAEALFIPPLFGE